jgi:hypothetical protein
MASCLTVRNIVLVLYITFMYLFGWGVGGNGTGWEGSDCFEAFIFFLIIGVDTPYR